MAKKYYAVREGFKKGIYTSWPECQKQINGYSGAAYKGFPTLEEANDWLEGGSQQVVVADDHEIVKAYVDGSYDHSQKAYAGGGVLILNGEEIHTISKAGYDEELATMRNVAGELLGAMEAMAWFDQYHKQMSLKKLVIYHDYEGIAKWAQGDWKTNREGTKAYKATCEAYKKKFPIEFVKVAAHTGDHYNEMADQLAKKALGIL